MIPGDPSANDKTEISGLEAPAGGADAFAPGVQSAVYMDKVVLGEGAV